MKENILKIIHSLISTLWYTKKAITIALSSIRLPLPLADAISQFIFTFTLKLPFFVFYVHTFFSPFSCLAFYSILHTFTGYKLNATEAPTAARQRHGLIAIFWLLSQVLVAWLAASQLVAINCAPFHQMQNAFSPPHAHTPIHAMTPCTLRGPSPPHSRFGFCLHLVIVWAESDAQCNVIR